MGIVLDTNAYSAGASNDYVVRQRMSEASGLVLPVIVLGELLFGFRKGNRFAQNRRALDRFLAEDRVQVVVIDDAISEQYATLKYQQEKLGKTVSDNDLWIAATAVELGLPILTLDSDFNQIVGVRLVGLKR